MASARSCEAADFCSEFAGATDVSFFRIYQGDPASRLIARRDGLLLIADMSPLMVGHMLLLPERHYLSFAALAGDQLPAMASALSWLRSRYLETFGQFAVLEHGSSGELVLDACITHAHWHIVPLAADQLLRIARADGLRPVQLPWLTGLAAAPWSRCSYFYISDGDRHLMFTPGGGQPKQYLRSVMGRALSMADPEWDYAVVVRKEFLRETMRLTAGWSR